MPRLVLVVAFLVQYTQTKAPTDDHAAAAPEVRKYRASASGGACVGNLDTRAVGMNDQKVLHLLFENGCGQRVQVLMQPRTTDVLDCRHLEGTTEGAAINTKFTLPNEANFGLRCVLKPKTARGKYPYKQTDCTVTAGSDTCSVTVAEPLAAELEIHVPGR